MPMQYGACATWDLSKDRSHQASEWSGCTLQKTFPRTIRRPCSTTQTLNPRQLKTNQTDWLCVWIGTNNALWLHSRGWVSDFMLEQGWWARPKWRQLSPHFATLRLRDGETTIQINLRFWGEGGALGAEGGPKGGHLKGVHLKMGFALKFALDTWISHWHSHSTPQFTLLFPRQFHRESAV